MSSLFSFDESKNKNFKYLIGTDEAGRGPGAGPVYAAAVCFPETNSDLIKKLSNINDSKQLNESHRNYLFDLICENAIFHIDFATVEEIETLNILKASLLTMKKCCENVTKQLCESNVKVIVDGNKLIPDLRYPQEYIIKGDSKSASIAAASILAKVSRDRFMKQIHGHYPEYKWEKNKGYLTKEHLEAIDKHGTTPWHRPKFLEKHFAKAEQLTLSL